MATPKFSDRSALHNATLNPDGTHSGGGGGGGATDHGALTGLADNDHPQYATDTDLTSHAATPHGNIDHGALTGLADDDHPQYATDTDLSTGLTAQTAALTTHAGTSHGVTAHSGLSGLAANDHPQYIQNPMTTAGDLIRESGASNPINQTTASAVNALIVTGTVETIMRDITVTLTSGFSVSGNLSVAIDVYTSMNWPGNGKNGTLRLRRTNASGTVLASFSINDLGDSGSGNQHHWVTTFIDTTPTDRHYVLTGQVNGSTQLYSASRSLTVTGTELGPVTPERVPIGTAGQVFTVVSGAPNWATPTAPTAASVPFTPVGTIAATNVQAAIAEVASEAGAGGGGSSVGAPLATVSVELPADFTTGSGSAWTDITGLTGISLSAGTWVALVDIEHVAAISYGPVFRVTDGTTIYAQSGLLVSSPVAAVSSHLHFDSKPFILSATTTLKAQYFSDTAITLKQYPTRGASSAIAATRVTFINLSAGGGGSLVFLEEKVASASATLDFTSSISSLYDDYVIEILGVAPATNASYLTAQFGTGATPTYDAAANYYHARYNQTTAPAAGGAGGGPVTAILLSSAVSNAAGGYAHLNATLHLKNPQSTTLMKYLYGDFAMHDGTNINVGFSGGLWANSASPATALRFLFNAGNIASGIIRIYGVAKTAVTPAALTGVLAAVPTNVTFGTAGTDIISMAAQPPGTYLISTNWVVLPTATPCHQYWDVYAGATRIANGIQICTNNGWYVTWSNTALVTVTTSTVFKMRASSDGAGQTAIGMAGGSAGTSIIATRLS